MSLGNYLRSNQEGPVAQVCNCGYAVSEAARGQGVAAKNAGVVRLWQRMGFEITGTLAGAFEHPRLGFVATHIMFKQLAPAASGA